MPSVTDELNLLAENNKRLAPVFAPWFRAYLECSDEVQAIVRDMFEIISDEASEASEKEMAAATVAEALFPSSLNGAIGADLLELEEHHKSTCSRSAEALEQMDAQEKHFSVRVAHYLKEQGLTQEQLGKAIGIGQTGVSMLLSRESRPQRRTVEKIAKALDVDPSELWPEIGK